MRKNKINNFGKNNFGKNNFGNWENKEAFAYIERMFNADQNFFINTINDKYMLNKNKIGYQINTKSGFVVNINSFEQMKSLFKNQLITDVGWGGYPSWEIINVRRYLNRQFKHEEPTRRINKKIDELSLQLHKNRLERNFSEIKTFKINDMPSKLYGIDCPICLNEFGTKRVDAFVSCGHMFHHRCINEIDICPMCRQMSLKVNVNSILRK